MNGLLGVSKVIDRLNNTVGGTIAWLALPLVVVQFLVVVLRYVFGYGSIMMQELVIYFHAFIFMVGAACVLLRGGHVRVDIFYQGMTNRAKAKIDLFGCLVFLIPVSVLVWWTSWPVAVESWRILEGSKETSGIQAVFLLKSLALVMSGLLIIQGISMAIRAWLVLKGELDTHIVKEFQHNPDLPDDLAAKIAHPAGER